MKSSQLDKSRFIVGILLIAIAVLIFLFAKGDYASFWCEMAGLKRRSGTWLPVEGAPCHDQPGIDTK